MTASQQKALSIQQRKGSSAITCLTGYDYPTARLLDEAGIDIILVGDSLGMVVLGFQDTTQVTMQHMLHHTAAVARGAQRALIVGDLPIHSYDDPARAVENAKRLIAAGADAVKLEGGIRQVDKVRAIVDEGIPVLGHLGMLPQRVKEEGGYKKKGKSQDETQHLIDGALALQSAGVFGIVLESVVANTAAQLTTLLEIPTIGIGCGTHTCDGEIAVITDLTGSFPWFVPPFATVRANSAEETTRAVKEYIQAAQQSPKS